MKNIDDYMEGTWCATIKERRLTKHKEEEDASPNRNHILTNNG